MCVHMLHCLKQLEHDLPAGEKRAEGERRRGKGREGGRQDKRDITVHIHIPHMYAHNSTMTMI